jgi:PASTA domain
MNSLTTSTIADYATAVREALRDLSSEQASAVLDGLDDHLAEIAADGAGDLEATLGSPAAYAAELRASAGFEAKPNPAPPQRERWTEIPPSPFVPPTKQPLFGNHTTTIARATIAAVLGLLAIVVIRATYPLNGVFVIFISAFVAAGWRAMKWLGQRARLSEPIASRLPLILAGAALVAAVFFGARTADSGQPSYGYNPGYGSATTFGGYGPGAVHVVPNLVGAKVDEAMRMLGAIGLQAIVQSPTEPDSLIVSIEPAPGSVVAARTTLILRTEGPSASTTALPGSAITTFPTIAVAVSTTTPIATTAVIPAATTAAATTVAPTSTTVVEPTTTSSTVAA